LSQIHGFTNASRGGRWLKNVSPLNLK